MKPGDHLDFDSTDYSIRMVEEERRRIARDLHDGPAQGITNLSMRLDILNRLLERQPDMAAEELARINHRVRSLVSEIRRLIYDLRPIAIDETGLLQATRQLCERNQEEWKLPIHITVRADFPANKIPASRQVATYRLIQELLQNIHKHAEATAVEVEFSASSLPGLCVRICDDGKGFDPSTIPQGHYGLVGIQERVSYLGGNIEMDSAPGRGSRFTIEVPFFSQHPGDKRGQF